MNSCTRFKILVVFLGLAATFSSQANLRERLGQRLADNRLQPTQLQPTYRNISYGASSEQQLDVYAPSHSRGAPVIVMVHGGGWKQGDKEMASVVDNKVHRWVSKGAIFVSVNYRLLPTPVDQQAEDVARAVKYVQQNVSKWGGDPKRLILMGHSAGAHLVALVGGDPVHYGYAPLEAVVPLDGAALDLGITATGVEANIQEEAFGNDPVYRASVSPLAHLTKNASPYLLVCSTRREGACPPARKLAEKAHRLGIRAQVIPLDLSHHQINETLGQENAYTEQVEQFLAGVDRFFAH